MKNSEKKILNVLTVSLTFFKVTRVGRIPLLVSFKKISQSPEILKGFNF